MRVDQVCGTGIVLVVFVMVLLLLFFGEISVVVGSVWSYVFDLRVTSRLWFWLWVF